MATHSSILACKIPWTEEPVRLHGVHKELDATEQLSPSISEMIPYQHTKAVMDRPEDVPSMIPGSWYHAHV